MSNPTDASKISKIAEKPWLILLLGLILGNTDRLVQIFVPDLEKYFATQEQFRDLQGNVDKISRDVVGLSGKFDTINNKLDKLVNDGQN